MLWLMEMRIQQLLLVRLVSSLAGWLAGKLAQSLGCLVRCIHNEAHENMKVFGGTTKTLFDTFDEHSCKTLDSILLLVRMRTIRKIS